MKKTILTLAMVLTAFTGLAATSSNSQAEERKDMKSRIYYFVHYRTWAPVYYRPVYYRPVYVAPVYPVYTYHYWYYRFSGR